MPPPPHLLSPITFRLDTPPARPKLLGFPLRRVPTETAWVSVGWDGRGQQHCVWLRITGHHSTLSSAGLPSPHTPATPVLSPLRCLGSLCPGWEVEQEPACSAIFRLYQHSPGVPDSPFYKPHIYQTYFVIFSSPRKVLNTLE